MSEPVSIVLVGIGGYGKTYVEALLDNPDPQSFQIVGAADPAPERCERLADLQERNIPIYPSLDEFYASHKADLAVISAPIHLHCPLSVQALERGSNVLCEKPLCATIQEARRMIEARDRAGKFLAIGYQWSFSPAIQALKRDIRQGRFGKPIRLKTIVLWPRDETYYARNSWAAVARGAQGEWILDSPVNNATAHYLHNMFYVLGDRADSSGRPASVTAELYRAKPIENYDTAAARCLLDTGVELYYYASHSIETPSGPILRYEFEKGVVDSDSRDGEFSARFEDGATENYGAPQAQRTRKVFVAIDAVRGQGEIPCGPEAASAQTLCMNGMQESSPGIIEFPESTRRIVSHKGNRMTVVEGLADCLLSCYDQWKLPSDLGAPWSRPGREIDLSDYRRYPNG